MMNGATAFINKTLNDVLFVHEIEEGALELVKKPFRFETIMADSLRSLRCSVISKNVNLVVKYAGSDEARERDSPLLIGDRNRIENVVSSFIDAALNRSSPLTTITVEVSMKYSDVLYRSSRVHKVINVLSSSSRGFLDKKTDTEKSLIERDDREDIEMAANAINALDDDPVCVYVVRSSSGVGDGTSSVVSANVAVSTATGVGVLPVPTPVPTPTPGEAWGSYRVDRDDLDTPTKGSPNMTKIKTLKDTKESRSKQKLSTSETKTSPTRRISASKTDRFHVRVCEVTMVVKDEGDGISQSDLEGLMKPYSQIRPDHSEQGRGTGLWLYLAREIISLHGGEITVVSEPGEGSRFGFCIPFILASPSQERALQSMDRVNTVSECLYESVKSGCLSEQDLSAARQKPKQYLIVDGKSRIAVNNNSEMMQY